LASGRGGKGETLMPVIIPCVLTEALRLFDRGLWVVPCEGKRAIVPGWDEKRLTRVELQKALEGKKLNIAIALNQSDLIDVECDRPEAEPNLQAMFGGKVPPTPPWRSKRGLHRLFRRPPGLPEKAKLELDGIEFRIGNGKGALSVVPPSVHPDGPRYAWLPGLSLYQVEPADLPPEVVERLRAPEPPPPSGGPAPEGEIKEGKRNDTLFRLACSLRDLKLPADTILVALLDANRRRCKPPLPEAEVRGIVESVAKGESKAGCFLTRLLDEIELWHDENDDPYLTLVQGDHRENWRIGKRFPAFRRWLSKRCYEVTGGMLTVNTLAEIASLLEGRAVHDGQRYPVYRRIAGHGGKFYLDLCDEKWRAVEIDADGWRIVEEPPVKFRRAKAMHPLPIPKEADAGAVGELLKPFLNVKDAQWPLVAAWLAAALRPAGPYPLLKLLGEQGAAKTTTARALRALIDPNAAPVRAEPRNAHDLMIASNNGWLLCLDNLSYIPPWLSDALCRVSTGGGFSTRTLYSDEDETIFDARRPVILTSIEDIGARSDLLERSLIIELPTIREGARRAERAFWQEFEEKRPKILGALLNAVAGAMRRLPEVERQPGAELSRMADFEQWGRAVEGPLGLEPGTFAESYAANREAATQIALESSPVVAALFQLLEQYPRIEKTATVLLNDLGLFDSELKRSPGWPKTPRVLSQILRRGAPNLRQVGIVAVQGTRGGGDKKEKVWRIEKTGGGAGPAPEETPPRSIDPCDPGTPEAPKTFADHLRARAAGGGRVAK
jgi:hypothetical protein